MLDLENVTVKDENTLVVTSKVGPTGLEVGDLIAVTKKFWEKHVNQPQLEVRQDKERLTLTLHKYLGFYDSGTMSRSILLTFSHFVFLRNFLIQSSPVMLAMHGPPSWDKMTNVVQGLFVYANEAIELDPNAMVPQPTVPSIQNALSCLRCYHIRSFNFHLEIAVANQRFPLSGEYDGEMESVTDELSQ